MDIKVGDKVRIYDICRVSKRPTQDLGYVAQVKNSLILVTCSTWANTDRYDGNYFHIKQLRKVRVK